MKTSGKLLRAIRKYYGVNQLKFSELTDIKQGTLSRLEANKLGLSAYEWIKICSVYNLDPNALITGVIQAFDPISINPEKSVDVGIFKMHKDYKHFMGSTVRTLYPFYNLLVQNIGEDEARSFYKSLGVDADYFVIQNLPISLKLIEETFNLLMKRGLISKKNLAPLFQATPTAEIHEMAIDMLQKHKDPELKFKKFTKIIADHYEQNSLYEFVGENKCYIQVRNNEFVGELGLSSEFKSFRELYNLQHFNNLAPHFNSDKKFQVESFVDGWDLAV